MTVHPEELPGLRGQASELRAHEVAELVGEPYGLLAEFTDEHALLAAVQLARATGYTRMDAFTPYPVEGLAELLTPPVSLLSAKDRGQLRRAIARRDWRAAVEWVGRLNLIALLTLGAGLSGMVIGYGMQLFSMAVWYPHLNVGGRPVNSWPYYIPITYELTILLAALTALFGMIVLNGLPRPHHPVFSVPEFARASQDRFFLLIQVDDPQFVAHDPKPGVAPVQSTRRFLESLAPGRVYDASS